MPRKKLGSSPLGQADAGADLPILSARAVELQQDIQARVIAITAKAAPYIAAVEKTAAALRAAFVWRKPEEALEYKWVFVALPNESLGLGKSGRFIGCPGPWTIARRLDFGWRDFNGEPVEPLAWLDPIALGTEQISFEVEK
jgi:hypothetical protein